MVNLDTHRIIDIIDSRETSRVEEWLKSYPRLEIISRDGAQTYSSAAKKSHPDAIQISDRFYLLKNLSDAVEKYMYRLFPSRLVIPATVSNPEMQALYDTRNRRERILFAQKKRTEGYSINDIALFLLPPLRRFKNIFLSQRMTFRSKRKTYGNASIFRQWQTSSWQSMRQGNCIHKDMP
ncbi:MAG: transposase [Lachnospiraceae bacterium]